MGIDVLSQEHTSPIIVGDEAEMIDLESVGTDGDGRFHLVMAGKPVPLSPEASTNFATAKHLLLVNVTPTDEISSARKVRIDNLSDGHDLTSDQRRHLAAALTLGGGSPRQFRTAALAEFSSSYPDIAAA